MSAAVGVQRTSVPLDENEDVAAENLSAKTRYALLVRGELDLSSQSMLYCITKSI